MLKKIWNDPVGSKIISALLVGMNLSAAYAWWAKIVVFLSAFWGSLVATRPVHNGIIVLASLLILVNLAAAILIGLAARKDGGAAINAYRTGSFEGLKWCWGYGIRNEITNLYPFCPVCDYQIIPQEVGVYASAPRTRFYCDVCRTTLLEVDEHADIMETRVERLIHRQIRMKINQAKAVERGKQLPR